MSLGPRVFCDTSFFFAALAPRDVNHARAGEILAMCRKERTSLISSWDVVSETATLLTYRLHARAGVAFLESVKPALTLVPTTLAALEEAERVFRRLAPRQRLSFCDAISFVIVSTVLDNVPCLTFDRDFEDLGLTVVR